LSKIVNKTSLKIQKKRESVTKKTQWYSEKNIQFNLFSSKAYQQKRPPEGGLSATIFLY